jgi:hypothetical protein
LTIDIDQHNCATNIERFIDLRQVNLEQMMLIRYSIFPSHVSRRLIWVHLGYKVNTSSVRYVHGSFRLTPVLTRYFDIHADTPIKLLIRTEYIQICNLTLLHHLNHLTRLIISRDSAFRLVESAVHGRLRCWEECICGICVFIGDGVVRMWREDRMRAGSS